MSQFHRAIPPNNKPLNERELRLLLSTPGDKMLTVFPSRTREFLRSERQRALRALPPEELINRDAEKLLVNSKQREMERLYKAALSRVEELESELSLYKDAPEVHPHVYEVGSKSPSHREAAAVVLASDWHCEEKVTAEQVNGLNEYSLKVFEKRSKYFFINVLKLLDKEAQAVDIRNLVVWLGGDMITGNIHADLSERNQLGPMDAVGLAQDTIAGGIQMLLKDTSPDLKLTIPVSVGNHSRITKEQRVATEQENALEWLMYMTLAQFFKHEPRVKFILNRSLHTYVDVMGKQLRFHHGHSIRYKDGIGGLTIPAAKKISKWNYGKQAYLDCFGHWHTLFFGDNFISNGSMIGYSPFSIWVGAPYQPPQQAFFLIDAKWGLTGRFPIILEEV